MFIPSIEYIRIFMKNNITIVIIDKSVRTRVLYTIYRRLIILINLNSLITLITSRIARPIGIFFKIYEYSIIYPKSVNIITINSMIL